VTDVLVAFASRHGSTDELAHAIGLELTAAGLSVEVQPMDEVESLEEYDALVLGSAVYMGSWLPAGRAFVERHERQIAERPTWLFSSGPLAEPGANGADRFDASRLLTATHARDHHLFGGKLDRAALTMRERAVARLVRAQDGDHRDLPVAAAWATAISRAVTTVRPA
jgi:menaquinone-dependent protoporphyrinogen oxidase